MTKDKKDIFLHYITEIAQGQHHHSFDYIGRCIVTITHFLDHVDKVNKKEYRRYVTENAALYNSGRVYKFDYILEFLSFAGVGYKQYQKKAKRLEKLSDISESNQKKINDFANWLPTNYDYSQNTLRIYLTAVRQFFEYCNDFTMENVRRFIATLEEQGRSPATIELKITSLVTYGEFIGKEIKIKRPKIQLKLNLETIPTEAEYNKLCEWLKAHDKKRYYLYVRILATSGCRASEFRQLKWSDVLGGEVVLRCKGNKYRRLFFPKSLQKEVKEFLSDEVKADDYVAMSKYGHRLSDRGFAQGLKAYGEAAGIDKEKVHPHAFRHFFAKKFLAKNKNDIVALADLLGHSNLDTTRIYTQKSYDEQKRDYHRAVTW